MKKRIAFISEHASPLASPGSVDSGGQNVYVAQLCEHLSQLGYIVDIFTRKDRQDQQETVRWKSCMQVVHVEAGPASYVPKEQLLPYMHAFAENMIQYIQANQLEYTLIHANFFMSGLVASQIKQRLGIPYVITFHALGQVRRIHQKEKDGFPEDRIAIEKWIVADADRLIAECPQDMEDLIEHYQADPERITIVPCGFNPREFHPLPKIMAKKTLGLAQEEKIILQLGRMVPRKGVDNVIRAMALIQRCDQPMRLVIVGSDVGDGEGPEIQRLKRIAVEEGIAEKVSFVGRKSREELKYYYAAADLFISTPWYEPFGITPLEAMACGTPVIGSNVGGIKYSVVDGETGFLVPPHQPKALAEKIEEVLCNKQLYKYLRENSIKRVNQLFTWYSVANMIHGLYEYVMEMNSHMAVEEEQFAINE